MRPASKDIGPRHAGTPSDLSSRSRKRVDQLRNANTVENYEKRNKSTLSAYVNQKGNTLGSTQSPTRKVCLTIVTSLLTESLAIRMPFQLGHTNIPDSATFPNGLPEALETLVATQASSPSSDSDYGGMQLLLATVLVPEQC